MYKLKVSFPFDDDNWHDNKVDNVYNYCKWEFIKQVNGRNVRCSQPFLFMTENGLVFCSFMCEFEEPLNEKERTHSFFDFVPKNHKVTHWAYMPGAKMCFYLNNDIEGDIKSIISNRINKDKIPF